MNKWPAIQERIRYDREVLRLHVYHTGYYAAEPTPSALEGEPSEWWLRHLEPYQPRDVASCLRPAPHPNGCGGRGYYRSFDTEYDCGGCTGCSAAHRARWDDQEAWHREIYGNELARWEAGVTGLKCLANFGLALAHLAKISRILTELVSWAWTAWRTVLDRYPVNLKIGEGTSTHDIWVTHSDWRPARRWYQIVGRRGQAAKNHGFVGECVAVREGAYGGMTCCLKKLDQSTAWAALGQVVRVHTPPEAIPHYAALDEMEERARTVPRFRGVRGDVCFVPQIGEFREVFWVGEHKLTKVPRIGVKIDPRDKKEEAMWLDSYQAWPVKPSAVHYADDEEYVSDLEWFSVKYMERGMTGEAEFLHLEIMAIRNRHVP